MTQRTAAVTLALLTALALDHAYAVAVDPSPVPSGNGAAASAEKPVTTASGLSYVDIKVGTGATPKKGQTVLATYTIMVGEKRVESSRPSQPLQFVLGHGQTMKAIDEGVATMKVGGQRTLTVPPELAYGTEGVPGKIPPNSTLTINIELVEIR